MGVGIGKDKVKVYLEVILFVRFRVINFLNLLYYLLIIMVLVCLLNVLGVWSSIRIDSGIIECNNDMVWIFINKWMKFEWKMLIWFIVREVNVV